MYLAVLVYTLLTIYRGSTSVMSYHEQSTNLLREDSIVFNGAQAPGVTPTDLPFITDTSSAVSLQSRPGHLRRLRDLPQGL